MVSYQNVSTPRFYIDKLSYLREIGYDLATSSGVAGMIGFNPSLNVIRDMPANDDGSILHFGVQFEGEISIPKEEKLNFCAILGHNYGGRSIQPHFHKHLEGGDGWQQCQPEHVEIVNSGNTGYSFTPDFNGFTITEMITSGNGTFDSNGQDEDIIVGYLWQGAGQSAYQYKTGSWAVGQYYEMPVAPDLSLSLEHDYSGIKKTTSMSGASFSNANWIKPPKWGDREAWQLGDFPRQYSGRRIWDLSFSYISDSDLEPRNYTGTIQDSQHQQGDENWFENVLHYTMGGHLPFIFQPDKDAVYTTADPDSTPDSGDEYINEIPEFAICRFDMNSFLRIKVAHNLYTIKIRIRESW